jgi:hypothetical protein
LFAKDILEVLYAPHKAFKAITQNPKYIGPVVIMILFVIANLGFGYVLLSKSYFDQTAPSLDELDKWTESKVYWNSSATITLNSNDYITGTSYGNNSIEFSSLNSSQIWTRLLILDPVNCTGPEGYTLLSLRVKQLEPSTEPSNVSLYMFSTNQDSFYYNLTSELNETAVWNNMTIPIGPEATSWQTNSGSPDWGNITELMLEFTWSTNSNITLLIDGLFFHGVYKPVSETASTFLYSPNFTYSPLNTFIQFTILWVALGIFLFLIPKLFGTITTWKPLIATAGFVQITLIIQTIIFTAVLLTWPNFYYSLKILGGVPGEATYLPLFESISIVFWYIQRAIYVWAIGLCAVALRSMFSFSWLKTILVSVLAYLLSVLAFNFLAYGTIWI